MQVKHHARLQESKETPSVERTIDKKKAAGAIIYAVIGVHGIFFWFLSTDSALYMRGAVVLVFVAAALAYMMARDDTVRRQPFAIVAILLDVVAACWLVLIRVVSTSGFDATTVNAVSVISLIVFALLVCATLLGMAGHVRVEDREVE